jgi:ankyrin repeat protein
MRRLFLPVMGVAVLIGLLGGCGDREDAASGDLGDAGYSMTAGDFFRAAEAGDTAALGRFLQGGFDLDTRDEAGDSVLHVAAAAGQDEVIGYLLDRGMSVNAPGAGGASPLAAAVAAGETGSVRYLLRNGADPDQRDSEEFKPLMRAVETGRVEVVEELAPYVRHDLDTALLMAALLGKPGMIDALTNYGASVYARTDDGRTALMVAAEQGHLGAARMLLEIGANRFATDGDGRIAAELAEAGGHTELAAELRAVGSETGFGLEEPAWPEWEDAVADAGDAGEGVIGPDGGADVIVEGIPAETGAGDPLAAVPEAPAGSPGPEEAASAGEMPWNRPQPGEGAATFGDHFGEARPAAAGSAPRSIKGATISRRKPVADEPVPLPAIAMRSFREPALPLRVESAGPGVARVRVLGGPAEDVEVAEGARVPGSRLKVVRIDRRVDHSKLNNGQAGRRLGGRGGGRRNGTQEGVGRRAPGDRSRPGGPGRGRGQRHELPGAVRRPVPLR